MFRSHLRIASRFSRSYPSLIVPFESGLIVREMGYLCSSVSRPSSLSSPFLILQNPPSLNHIHILTLPQNTFRIVWHLV